MRVATWNVNGIRKRFDEVVAFADRERPDLLCLQEIKATPEQVPEGLFGLTDYAGVWHGAPGGYSGVSLHVRRGFGPTPSFTAPPFDHETRVMQADVGDLSVLSVYVPNGGRGLEPKLAFLDGLRAHAAGLVAARRRVLVCGDLNVTRGELDLHPSERKPGMLGQREDERARLEALLAAGLVDVTRSWLGEREDFFTWWAPWRQHRQKNRGWRIDYVLATGELAAAVRDVRVLREQGSSDHGLLVVDVDAEPPA